MDSGLEGHYVHLACVMTRFTMLDSFFLAFSSQIGFYEVKKFSKKWIDTKRAYHHEQLKVGSKYTGFHCPPETHSLHALLLYTHILHFAIMA